MLGIEVSDLKQTRLYQSAVEEGEKKGRQEGELALVLRQLQRRFENLTEEQEQQIRSLSLEAIEALSLDWLDFETVADLNRWLQKH